MALPPLLEIMIHSLHMHEHRRFLLRNLLANCLCLQAPWSNAHELAQ
jgi:hypothetical protein